MLLTVLINGILVETAHETITIPPGTAPFSYNATCSSCYGTIAVIDVFAAFTSDTGTLFNVDQDDVAINSLGLYDGDGTWAVATFGDLVPGAGYTLSLWCNNPPMVQTMPLPEDSHSEYGWQVQPDVCHDTRYLLLASDDGARIAINAVRS